MARRTCLPKDAMVMTDAVDGPYGSVLGPRIQAKWSDVVLARREAEVARVSNSQEHSL